MRAHYLQHDPAEGLGNIEAWLQQAGYEITRTCLYDFETLPEAKDIDILVIMGGVMSVNDEAEYAWLVPEKQFIRQVIDAGKPVLGICLGAQLIANVMGAKIYANPVREIGWFPIQAVDVGSNDVFQFPESAQVFHWHGETFELPEGAVRLAKSEGCLNQAFQLGTKVIGLQCHLEMTPEAVKTMVSHGKADLVANTYIQTEAEILSAPAQQYQDNRQLMESVLTYLTKS